MSRHVWTATIDGQEWDAAAGWDRPVGHFFLTVQRTCPACTGTGRVATVVVGEDKPCLDCGETGTQTLFDSDALDGIPFSDIGFWLIDHHVPYPERLAFALRDDYAGDVGNVITHYTSDQLRALPPPEPDPLPPQPGTLQGNP